ncbi:MAG: hypothetical protein HYY06_07230 [Deltaproteobacteria bacterium]|nr:hypothetical protein [Deltaproteobacteria bacterium]
MNDDTVGVGAGKRLLDVLGRVGLALTLLAVVRAECGERSYSSPRGTAHVYEQLLPSQILWAQTALPNLVVTGLVVILVAAIAIRLARGTDGIAWAGIQLASLACMVLAGWLAERHVVSQLPPYPGRLPPNARICRTPSTQLAAVLDRLASTATSRTFSEETAPPANTWPGLSDHEDRIRLSELIGRLPPSERQKLKEKTGRHYGALLSVGEENDSELFREDLAGVVHAAGNERPRFHLATLRLRYPGLELAGHLLRAVDLSRECEHYRPSPVTQTGAPGSVPSTLDMVESLRKALRPQEATR